MNTEEFIGLTLEEALKLASSKKLKFRVVKEDSKVFVGSYDFFTDRVNVEIEKGKIVQAGIG